MLARHARFLFGMLTGMLASGLLALTLARPRGVPVTLLPPPSPVPLRVHVAGAVVRPGVYTLPAYSLTVDAITAAGGARADADLDAVNLVAPVEPGARLFVPGAGTAVPDASTAGAALIDLNRASAAELETLPGIGPTLAAAIVRHREEHGDFLSVEELLEVPGIGPARFQQLQSLVHVD